MIGRIARQRRVAVLLLCIVSILVYGQGAVTPSLFEDEWYRVRELASGATQCPDNSSFFLRPLTGCYYALVQTIVGLDIRAFHLMMLAWRALIAIALYGLLLSLAPKWKLFALAVASIFLVFPTTFMWPMFDLSHIYLSYLTCLVGSTLLVLFYSQRLWLYWLLSSLLFIFSLLLYEAGIGIMIYVAVLVLLMDRTASNVRRAAMAFPIVLGIVFSIGRWATQLQAGSAFGHSTEQIIVGLSPFLLLKRLARGYWVSLGRSGLDSIYDVVDSTQHFPYRELSIFVALLLVISTLALGYLAYRYRHSFSERFRPSDNAEIGLIPWQTTDVIKVWFLGLLAIGAGYFPTIVSVDPGMSYGASRINLLPGAGAAICIVATLILLVKLSDLQGKNHYAAFVILVLAVMVLSARTQIRSQQESIRSWEIQRSFWNLMFDAIPDLRPGTHLILTLPGAYTNAVKFGAPPFAIYWNAFGGAVGLLYGHTEPFSIGVIYGAGPESISVANDLLYIPPHAQQPQPVPIPADRTVVLNFDERRGTLDVLQSLEQRDGQIFELCRDCVMPSADKQFYWRELVR